MESYQIEHLRFTYPNSENEALHPMDLTVKQGEFITICGKSGCGKTTFLRLLKPLLAPFGTLAGNILFEGKPVAELGAREQAERIGFVLQSPDHQIVTDKVWHELAFGLESLGYSTPDIRTRVSEMASFFGIQTWFHKKVTELSGGQKQLLNLASVMVMQPSVLILDEPTSQLDPIAAQEFFNTLEKINRELGITVILSEHRLEDAFAVSDRVIVMERGRVIADAKPSEIGTILKSMNHDMYAALPAPMRTYGAVENGSACPVTVRQGRAWLEQYSKNNPLHAGAIPQPPLREHATETAIEIKDVWFRYEKNLPDVIKGLHCKVGKGELFAVVGGNGTGKTTALSLIAGLQIPYRGEILLHGKNISKVKHLYQGVLGMLPQNPQSVFVKKTVFLDLMEILSEQNLSKEQKEEKIRKIALLCRVDNLLDRHPYDLSGGEQQRAALAKVLLQNPEILLFDEPTKGMDAHFKEEFADILEDLKANGVTIVMVSHDIEFCAKHADRCAMFFDGNITSTGAPRAFFAGNNFYTTSANRMARTRLPKAILAEDVILACGGTVPSKEEKICPCIPKAENKPAVKEASNEKRYMPARIVAGSIFALLFVFTSLSFMTELDWPWIAEMRKIDIGILQIISIAEMAAALFCFLPQKRIGSPVVQTARTERKLTKRTLISALLILLAVPLTIYIGIYYLGDRKYYFISLFIILETMIPFVMVFENRKPQARELVLISVLCAIAVAGRAAFFMLPQFKPVVALIIIVGVCFGGETGFLVGALTGFVSNFFFGQGPWTPWQMFAFGMIGFIAGILFRKGFLQKTKGSLCVFGFLATFFIYGGIMNPSYVIQSQTHPTLAMFITSYLSGAPFDLVHAVSTSFFLWFLSEPMIDKLERMKIKYGFLER